MKLPTVENIIIVLIVTAIGAAMVLNTFIYTSIYTNRS